MRNAESHMADTAIGLSPDAPPEGAPHNVEAPGQSALQPGWGTRIAIIGFAASLALFAGAFLQQGIDAWIYGPLPEGVITCADGFEKVCMALLLLLNPQLFAFMVVSVVIPSAWMPSSIANALFLVLIPAWWLLLARLSAQRPQANTR